MKIIQKYIIFIITFFSLLFINPLQAEENIEFNLGKNIDERIISKIDITVDSSGSNLPNGAGSPKEGKIIFNNKCVSCHLEKDFYNTADNRNKNEFNSIPINLNWIYPKTLFDYIRKTMPYEKPQSLTDDETYALTSYLLFKNNKLKFEDILNKEKLIKISIIKKDTFLTKWNDEKNNILNTSKYNNKFFNYVSQFFNSDENELQWYSNKVDKNYLDQKILTEDISISPIDINLPKGEGNAIIGEKVYQAKCLSCHGTEGKAEELSVEVESIRGNQNTFRIIAFESLSGGLGSLSSEMPIKSIGSFWPHASTLFDYIRRAMPYFEPQSLTNDEAYAVTAYILFINNIINKDDVINDKTLQKVNMPNKAGFIDSWGPDWWREWLHQKYGIIFTITLLTIIIIIILFAQKLTQNLNNISLIKLFLTTVIFLWFGIYQSLQIGTQKLYQTYNSLKLHNGIWENVLFDPIYILLGTFIIISTLIWGRGIFCGWICPFGTIQDLLFKVSKKIKLNKFEIPQYIHNKLIYLKYIILGLIIGSTLYTTGHNIFIEFEPFNTVIVKKFNTSTIYLLWALTILTFVFFIERGFCRYLCPTGAALSIIGRFQVINWLSNIKSCGSESCAACSPNCPTKAIKKDGTINTRECIQCLSCQIVFNDKNIKCINKKSKNSIRINKNTKKIIRTA